MSLSCPAIPFSTRRMLMISCASLSSLIVPAMAWASAPIDYYLGTAFDSSGHALYTESHWISATDGDAKHLILFKCPDGKAFARKHVEDAGHPQTPLFELDDNRYGYREGVRETRDGKREVFVRRSADKAEQTALVEDVPKLVIDAGFDRFIVNHWDDLVAGNKQSVEFLLPSRLKTYSFILSPLGADKIEGKSVQRFRLELDSWLGFALPSLDMAYTTEAKAIREYSGVSNIRDNNGKNLKVRIDFPPAEKLSGVDPQTLVDAEAANLDGQCTL